ncbi:MAG: nucleoside phosphorylase [Salegentibacter sp.]
MSIQSSELILNPDGSIYHLNLKPEHVADTVITVGDPNRVEKITRHFDEVEFSIKKREFHTQTGTYKGKRITVISSGIGPDNIDIVLNELDALVNIDFEKREIKKELRSLDIIRIGTTGSIQESNALDSFILSELAIGFDGVMHFYDSESVQLPDFAEAFEKHLDWFPKKASPYVVSCDADLADILDSDQVDRGFTATNIGFYGPQGRVLRLALQDKNMNSKLASFSHQDKKITNLEMETSTIYAMSKMLGHRAVSMNAVVANRATMEFSADPGKTVANLIEYCLEKLVE